MGLAQTEEAGSAPERRAAVGALVVDIARHLPDVVVVLDQLGFVLWANEAMERVLGHRPEDWVGRHASELAHPDDIPLGMELLSSAVATGSGVKEPVTYRVFHRDGEVEQLEFIASNVALDTGELVIVMSGRRSRDRRPTAAVIDEASARVAAMFDGAPVGLAQVALDGRILRVNRELERLAGATSDSLAGQSFDSLLDERAPVPADVFGTLRSSGAFPVPVALRGRAGEAAMVQLTGTVISDRHGAPLYLAVQATDVTQLVRAHEALEYRSTHDPLTGLANRALLDAMFQGSPPEGTTGLVYVDLDGFKGINDRFGHEVGDQVLCHTARRLQRSVRGVDVVARLGGDEFVVVSADTDLGVVTAIAHRLVEACSAPLAVDGHTVLIGASAGVVASPHARLGDLLRRADSAMYEAKRAGGRQVVVSGETGKPEARAS